MAEMPPPPADRARPAAPTTPQARTLQRPRPRRWGRLLVLGVTLALVATLSTHALAEDTDGGSFFGEAPGAQPVSGQSPTGWLSADSGGGTTDWQATATVTVEERDQAQQDQSRGPAAA